jgi:hypothetical protein
VIGDAYVVVDEHGRPVQAAATRRAAQDAIWKADAGEARP